MQSRETSRSQDPDDWFADLEPAALGRDGLVESAAAAPTRTPAVAGEEGDDWLGDDARPQAHGRSTLAAQLSDRWVAVAAGVLLVACAVVGALVLGGAFSSSKPRPAAATPPIVSTPTTTAPATSQSPGATVSPPTATVKPGDQGTQVRALQRALAHLGYPPGKVDGIYGPLTKGAVARFQTAAKVKVDGICGPVTLGALVRALRGH
jgi:hypothetical protein